MWALYQPILKKYLRPERWTIFWGVLGGLVAAAASGFGLPFMIQYIFPVVFGTVPAPHWMLAFIDLVAPSCPKESILLWLAVLLIPFVMIVRGLATYINSYLLTKAGMNILTHLRTDVFARLQWLSLSYHDRESRGGLMTVVIQYTQGLQQGMVMVMNDLVAQPLTLLAALCYLFYAALSSSESAMLLINLLITAGCIPLVRYVGRRMVKQMRAALSGMNVITDTVEETLSAQREVRAFHLEERQETILRGQIRSFNALMLKMACWRQFLAPSIEVVSALALAYALYRGCSDGLTLEQFTAIAMAFYMCYDPIKRLGNVANQCQMLEVNIQGINNILEAMDETPPPVSPKHLPADAAGEVSFEHVNFAYEADKPVLRDINVSVPAGQVVALVGPSGSGKTTFINLICRFYDVQEGTVRLDGIDVRDLTREERTAHIGLVSQFSSIFRDSIGENIRVGRPDASDAEVRLAGDRARVTEFAEQFDDGYGHMLGESGSGLSGGQRQRISIARAFLKNAPILILDEATSALDMKSEALIQSALEDLAKGHTTFIIAHRFSTIRQARRILVFEAGRIIADGCHAELYENCVLYRHLYDEQLRAAHEARQKQEKELAV